MGSGTSSPPAGLEKLLAKRGSGESAFENSACSTVHPPHFMASSLQPAALSPALDGKACLSLSISGEGVAAGQAAITGCPALSESHLVGMSAGSS